MTTIPTTNETQVLAAPHRRLPPLDAAGSLSWSTTLSQSVQSALGALASYKIRAALTLIGILVGVAGLLLIDAFGQATQVASAAMLGSATLINIRYTPPSTGGVYAGTGQSTLTPQDLQAVQRLPHVIAVSPINANRFALVAGSNTWNSMVYGGGPALESIQGLSVKEGRFFTQQEDTSGALVVDLSTNGANGLFPGADPVGQSVRIGSVDFQVVGVLQPQGMTPAGHDMNEIVYVPLGGSQQRLFGQPFSTISLQVDSASSVPSVTEAITQTLRQSHHLGACQPGTAAGGEPGGAGPGLHGGGAPAQATNPSGAQTCDFGVGSNQQALTGINREMDNVKRVMGLVAGVFLLIGGVGIANVMLAAVSQRRREIGLRRAVGARQRDLLLQFLVEAVSLSLVGGVLGVGLGFGLWLLVGRGMPLLGEFGVWPSGMAVALALVAALVLGLIFGLYPAQRASRLDPVEALRRV